MEDLVFTPFEEIVLRASRDSSVTVRRKKLTVAFGLVAIFCPLAMGLMTKSWVWVVFLSTVYVLVTVLEKIVHANAVLAYKSVIRKLQNKIEGISMSSRNL